MQLLEINLNIKFLILDENMVLNTFNVFNPYVFNDYLDALMKLEDFQSTEEKVVNRKNYMLNIISNYNPTEFIFLQKVSESKYLLLKNEGNGVSKLESFDTNFLLYLEELYKKDNHFYKYDSQLKTIKEFVEMKKAE